MQVQIWRPHAIKACQQRKTVAKSVVPNVTEECCTRCYRRVSYQVLQKSVVSSVTGSCCTKCYRKMFYQVFTEVVSSVTGECCTKCDRGCHQQTTSVALSPRRAVERQTCCTALNFATPKILHCKNIVTLRITEYKC